MNLPAMPDPDPQPPQPRPVSAVRWLLMLTPSGLVIAVPMILTAYERLFSPSLMMPSVTIIFLSWAFGLWLCLRFGIRLEKWLHGEIKDSQRAFRYGFLIAFVNGIISFAGCAVGGATF
jgi:hypothetical protein